MDISGQLNVSVITQNAFISVQTQMRSILSKDKCHICNIRVYLFAISKNLWSCITDEYLLFLSLHVPFCSQMTCFSGDIKLHRTCFFSFQAYKERHNIHVLLETQRSDIATYKHAIWCHDFKTGQIAKKSLKLECINITKRTIDK